MRGKRYHELLLLFLHLIPIFNLHLTNVAFVITAREAQNQKSAIRRNMLEY